MDLGLMLPHLGPGASAEGLLAFARRAEELGFKSLSVLDRLLYPVAPKTPYPASPDGALPEFMKEVLEPLTVLTWLAAATREIKLVTGVLVAPLRNPVLLGRQLATLSILSGGRFVLGVGSGWSEDEYEAAGVPIADRGARLDEHLAVMQAMWGAEPAEHKGRYYTLPASYVRPRPEPPPAIWIGGESEAAMKRAARVGDAWYPSGYMPMDVLRQRIVQLKEMAGGRKVGVVTWMPATILPVDAPMPLMGPPQKIADGLKAYQDAGVDEVMLALMPSPLGGTPHELLEKFAEEVSPLLAGA